MAGQPLDRQAGWEAPPPRREQACAAFGQPPEPPTLGRARGHVNEFLMPLAGHLIRAGGRPALCCRHAKEHPFFADPRLRRQCGPVVRPGGVVMSDLLFVGLTVAFFALAAAFAWFCEKVR